MAHDFRVLGRVDTGNNIIHLVCQCQGQFMGLALA